MSRLWFVLLKTAAPEEWDAERVEKELKGVIGDYAGIIAVVTDPEISRKREKHD